MIDTVLSHALAVLLGGVGLYVFLRGSGWVSKFESQMAADLQHFRALWYHNTEYPKMQTAPVQEKAAPPPPAVHAQ